MRDVATVSPGYAPRLGIAGQDGDDDVVEGTVLMRRGEASKETINKVVAEVDYINSHDILPPGVKIERIYDRSDLIGKTTSTVLHNVIFGILLIFIVQWIFLADLRSALIVACTIPFALFFAVLIMMARGESANLAFGRRHRFRADRRCLRHHDGEYLPPPRSRSARYGEAPAGLSRAVL